LARKNDLHKIKNAARAILFVLPLAADKIRAGDVSGVKNFLANPAIVLCDSAFTASHSRAKRLDAVFAPAFDMYIL
jgi:hypothetical protein